jgi:hypothetical protein
MLHAAVGRLTIVVVAVVGVTIAVALGFVASVVFVGAAQFDDEEDETFGGVKPNNDVGAMGTTEWSNAVASGGTADVVGPKFAGL